MTDKKVIQEGVFDYIRKQREDYRREVNSPEKAEGVAGAVGTGLGRVARFARNKAIPGIGRSFQTVGGVMTGERKPFEKRESYGTYGNSPLVRTVTAGIAATNARRASNAFDWTKVGTSSRTQETSKPKTNVITMPRKS